MIIKTILNIIKWVGIILINFTTGAIGAEAGASLLGGVGVIVTTMLTFTDQALNFVYFIFGETMFLVLPISITMLVIRYTIAPLIILFRSFLIKGNN